LSWVDQASAVMSTTIPLFFGNSKGMFFIWAGIVAFDPTKAY